MIKTLNEIHASNPAYQRKVHALRIDTGLENIRLVRGYYNITALDDIGEVAEFEKTTLGISLPKRSAAQVQDLNFAFDTFIDGIYEKLRASKAHQRAHRKPVTVTYLAYNSLSLTSGPQDSFTMWLKSSVINTSKAQLRASFFDVLNHAFNNERFTTDKFPGLAHV